MLLRNEAGVSVRLCDGLAAEEELDLSALDDPTDRELAALRLPDAELRRLAQTDACVRQLLRADVLLV